MPENQIDTSYTLQVKSLITAFFDPKNRIPNIIDDANAFFSASASGDDKTADNDRHERVARLEHFIDRLLALTESVNPMETNNATAKFLGTLMLITDSQRSGFAKQHQILKPLYKAALSLRLCDALLDKANIRHSYLGKYIDSHLRYKDNPHWAKRWRKELAYPLVKAALLQDIGLYHPTCQKILLGENKDLDEFRLLAEKERKSLLKMNLKYSLAYLKQGLGMPFTKADTQQEKEQKEYIEQQALEFTLETVQDATILKNHIGDLIKVPQIYTSFILSTKSSYDKKDLPKGYIVIEQLMKNGTLESRIAQCFLKMVGYFPQGYGITYIASDEQGQLKEGYELAIVNRLYPSNVAEPKVRSVTRNLTYIKSGKDLSVKRDHNLYFQTNHKKIQRINKQRLNEILSELSGGPQEKKADDLIPQYWEPLDYFALKDNQNLWTSNR